eukprot:3752333-Amphidinium_carterae.1
MQSCDLLKQLLFWRGFLVYRYTPCAHKVGTTTPPTLLADLLAIACEFPPLSWLGSETPTTSSVWSMTEVEDWSRSLAPPDAPTINAVSPALLQAMLSAWHWHCSWASPNSMKVRTSVYRQ